MNKVSKLGKSILEIALRELGDYVDILSVSHQFDFFRPCNESIGEEVFGRINEHEQISFSYWGPLTGRRHLDIGYNEIFINAFIEADISYETMPTHFIIEKHTYCGTEHHEIVSSDYIIHYIEKSRRDEIINLKLKNI